MFFFPDGSVGARGTPVTFRVLPAVYARPVTDKMRDELASAGGKTCVLCKCARFATSNATIKTADLPHLSDLFKKNVVSLPLERSKLTNQMLEKCDPTCFLPGKYGFVEGGIQKDRLRKTKD